MIKKLREKWSDRHAMGDSIGICIGVMIAAMLIVMLIGVFSALVQCVHFQNATGILIEKASIQGGITQEVLDELDRQCEANDLSISITCTAPDGWYSEEERLVQYGDNLKITANTTVYLRLFGDFVSVPIELSTDRTGRSNIYWK